MRLYTCSICSLMHTTFKSNFLLYFFPGARRQYKTIAQRPIKISVSAKLTMSSSSSTANKLEGKFQNNPLPSSIIIHGEGSNNLSGGVQALIIRDIDAYEPALCLEQYRKFGLPTPPADDPTIQWLKPNTNSKGFVFLQSADKGMPFIPFDKCASPNRIILTVKAYWKLLSLFWTPQNRPNESEWMRLERKAQAQLDVMRTPNQVIALGPYLSYVGQGSNTFNKPLEVYKDWTLVVESYSESLWSKETPSQLTLRYIPTAGKIVDPLTASTGAHIRLFTNVMYQITTDVVMNLLKKSVREGYFTAASPTPLMSPAQCPPLQPPQLPMLLPPPPSKPPTDILAKATAAAKIAREENSEKSIFYSSSSAASSSSSSSEEEDNLEGYSMPVVAGTSDPKKTGGTTTTTGGGKTAKRGGKVGGKDAKPYDRPKAK